MVEAFRGISAQIHAYNEQQRIGVQEAGNYHEVEIKEEQKQPYFALSFVTFRPVIEPLLLEIKDTHPVLKALSPDQVQIRTFKPKVNEEYTQPGHFALIWRSGPIPELETWGAQQDAIDKFNRTNEKLTSRKRFSKRKEEKMERKLKEFGNIRIVVQGFNVIVVVADIARIDDMITPVVKLVTNYTDEVGSGFTLEDLDFEKQALIPDLALALDPKGYLYGKWPFHPRVRTYVTEGPDKIMPTGPFV